jgi:hypothetical protein
LHVENSFSCDKPIKFILNISFDPSTCEKSRPALSTTSNVNRAYCLLGHQTEEATKRIAAHI